MIITFTGASIMIGILLDLIIGDPEEWPHPVRFIGSLISEFEDIIRRKTVDSPGSKKRAGALLWFIIVICAALIPGIFLFIAWKISPHVYLVLSSVFCYQIMSAKCLRDESMMVKKILDTGDVHLARIRLSRIVGRDTDGLDEQHVIRATVETVAENCSDGAIAPMFFMALFGPVGGFVYKAVNTMDSMMGYRNEKYMDFGFFAARADDVFNFIPARLCALLMMASAFILRFDAEGAARIFLRDRKKSDSPNSGQCESVMAGALDIELLGSASYFGRIHDRPAIGDGIKKAESDDIERACDILYVTVILGTVFTLLWRIIWAKLSGEI